MKYVTADWCKNVNIPHPEFKYIFTIDLKGRIVEEKLKKENLNYENEKGLPNEGIHLLRMENATIRSYIDPYLLEHATPFRWIFGAEDSMNLLEEGLNSFFPDIKCNTCPSKDICGKDYLKFYTKVYNRTASPLEFYRDGSGDDSFRITGIEVKIFRSGAMSILLRFKWSENISIHDCLNLIRYPEDILIDPAECYFGALNELSRRIAHKVFTKFSVDDYFKKAREVISDAHFSLINEKFDDILGKMKAYENFHPHIYVGIFCPDITWVNSADPNTNFDLEPEYKDKSIIALANTTPEFVNKFIDPKEYVNKKNRARGEDIILLERRSWIIVSKRFKDDNAGKRYRLGLIETFLYSLETILATTLSIETFNENLEEVIKGISYEFNTGIERFYEKGPWKNVKRMISALQLPCMGEILENMRKFVSLLSKARSISPCEDITISMEAHLKSMTAIRAVKALKDHLSLTELISLARERMRNYTNFLVTGHNIIMAETRRVQNLLLVILTVLLVFLTLGLLAEPVVRNLLDKIGGL